MTTRPRPATAAPSVPAGPPERETHGFRPASRRRARVATGLLVAAVAIGGNVLVYSQLGATDQVLQVVRNVRAGEMVTAADLRAVDVDVDPSVPTVAADRIDLVAGQFARVYLASGSLIFQELVQPTPLVSAGTSVVAVEVRPTRVPAGLRERSPVMLVVVPRDTDDEKFVTFGHVVSRGDQADVATGVFGLSVEVAEADAATIAAGDDIRIVVLDPLAGSSPVAHDVTVAEDG
ncbi:MAG TPA: SAF domain-containing protein [Ilumatobacter sp.]